MKKILVSAFTIFAMVAVVATGTRAVFSDTETSTGNTFAAGSLDLNLDGGNVNVVKFNVSGMRPGSQSIKTWALKNVGSLNGYLDLTDISFSSDENGCLDPETDAGDVTCGTPGLGEGELANVLGITLFIDQNGNGWFDTGDIKFYDGLMKDLPALFNLNEVLNAGVTKNVTAQVNWGSTPDDNKAQGDSVTLNLSFTLGQNP